MAYLVAYNADDVPVFDHRGDADAIAGIVQAWIESCGELLWKRVEITE